MQLCMYALVQKGAFEGTFPFQKNMQLFKKSELLLKQSEIFFFNQLWKQYNEAIHYFSIDFICQK